MPITSSRGGSGARLLKPLIVLAALLLVAKPSCHGPSTPDEPGLPRGKPNATILENLPLIRSLEAASRPNSILVFLGGSSGQDGIASEGSAWHYQFAEPPLYRLREWEVFSDGRVVFLDEQPDVFHLDMTEIGPFLALDSPEAVSLVRRDYGGQEYLDRNPQARMGWVGQWIGRQPVWDIRFFNVGGFPPCQFNAVINAQSGELPYRNPPCP